MRPIRFGTSGWRGIIADEFTFERSRAVVAAIAAYLWETGQAGRGVLVTHDPRFLAEEFALQAARELAARGIDVLVTDRPTPTPAASSILLSRGLGAAVNFTASHNPPVYQGLKLSPSWGGPALPQTTSRVEELALMFLEEGLPQAGLARGRIETFDPVPEYLRALGRIVNAPAIAASGLQVVYDAIFGAGAGFLDRFLSEAGCRVTTLNGSRDVMFGGAAPEPSAERLAVLSEMCARSGSLGLSTDGDADRFGIVGQGGEYYTPNDILALLAHYLLHERKVPGDLARSVATTGLLDRVAEAHGRRCHETPVGFKYIGEMISRGLLAMGGEESAGMSMRGHVPEKDGILACLLAAEMSAVSGMALSELKERLDGLYGPLYSQRVDITLSDELMGRLRGLLDDPPLKVGGHRASGLVKVDGTKWLFDGGDWVLLRLSGTEPVARLYVESSDRGKEAGLLDAFREWIGVGAAAPPREAP